MNKDELVEITAKVFLEMVNLANVDWDVAYFRFCQPDASYHNCTWSYVLDKKIRLTELKDEELEEKYIDTLEGLYESIFDKIQMENDTRPIVAVLELAKTGQFKIKFDYSDQNAMQISRLAMGDDNSYFNGSDIWH